MAVVTPRARVVQGLLRRPSQLLSRPQRSHLVGLVLALVSGSTAKLRPLAERSSASRHRTCVGRFLAVTEWDEAAALAAQYNEVLRRLRLRKGDSMLHRKGIQRHWHLVCLAHLALTHHALAAIDDTAQKLMDEIPLPTLRHRLDALRRQLHHDHIRGFTRRIRSPRVRRKVQEFLARAA